jgi:glycyl-tRNA synthetase (class II)
LIDCKKCKSRLRADQLIEEYIEKNKITLEQIKEKIGMENIAV